MRNVPSLETVERDYSAKGVKFFYIYKALAHPENNGYISPLTLEERLLHVAEAKKKLGSRITWLCDTMSNDLKHALGDAPNSEFIVDPDGAIVVSRQWSRPQELREDLVKLVGQVEKKTTVADLKMKPLEPPETAATGVVPRLTLTARMMPVRVQRTGGSAISDEPLYVKLRAEVEPAYFQNGSGKLYLGFFLDPLYKVHWNNRTEPVTYQITTPEGLTITPTLGKGPQVKEDADADPREFLVDVSGEASGMIELTVRYFACDDAESFCRPVTQHYQITLERDRDGGSRRGGGRPGRGFAGRPGTRGPGPGGGVGALAPRTRPRDTSNPESAQRSEVVREAVGLFRKHDKNEDGKLDNQELTSASSLSNADADSDGKVSLQEIINWLNENRR